MEERKVSVVTVCYNSEKTIRRTIESVLTQTYQNIEYIIVDGDSKDQTLSIAREYEKKFEGRMRIISEPDEGIYDAMNKGIRHATGELIGILNSDDDYEKDAVEKIVSCMTEDPYQILYGFVRTLRDELEITVERQSHNNLRERMIGHPACFVTKKTYEDFGMYDTMYQSVADYDFMLRMDKIKEVTFIPVDAIIANFRLGGMSASNKAWLELLKLQVKYGILEEKEYKKTLRKQKVLSVFRRS